MSSNARATRALLVVSAALVLPVSALGNPLGGTVSTGSAAIAQSSVGKTVIDQKSQDVVIDWSSFNVGSGQTTQFVQPNSSALAVNRIGGASASQIFGTLDANGRIVLINGNGLLFGKDAKVNVGALIATSTDGTDSDLLAGKFAQAGNQSASVINRGTITTASHGTVALVAPNVSNSGTVRAKLGTVSLGAANAFTVDFEGDGLVAFAAQGDVNARASAANSGRLSGADVSMTAHAAEGIATGVVSNGGVIDAEGIHQAGGVIELDAGNGTLITKGSLDAAGKTGGGHIETSGAAAKLAGSVNAGQGGQWLVDPYDLTVDAAAAATIRHSLQHGTSVELQTTYTSASGPGIVTSGQGNIDIDSAISWNTDATLTLSAYRDVNVLASITVEGDGTLALSTTVGLPTFTGGSARFTDVVGGITQGTLSINSADYTLENSLPSLAAAIAANPAGDFALANAYNAKSDGAYTSSPIPTTFTGHFEGLGNAISYLRIAETDDSAEFQGLFAEVAANASVDNLKLVDVLFTGGDTFMGTLVGDNNGQVYNDFASGKLTDQKSVGIFGGLVAINDTDGVILASSSSVAVKIRNKTIAGGLAGVNEGTILVSYATGSVTGTTGTFQVGGLVGTNESTGFIENSYATGDMIGGKFFTGGLVGVNYKGSIYTSYSTGSVSGTAGGTIGGLVGIEDPAGTITNSYWDTSTSGITSASAGCGNPSNCAGVAGLTTAQFTSGLPAGFNSVVWGENADINGGLPYLLITPPA